MNPSLSQRCSPPQPAALRPAWRLFPEHGRHAISSGPDEHVRLADLALVPWIFDPADTAPGQWARNACREAGFEPDVRYVASDLLLQIHLAETGHAAAIIPGLLLSAVSRAAARITPLPGRPHRRLTTGVRAGAARHPAIRAFRKTLRHAVREAVRSEEPQRHDRGDYSANSAENSPQS